MGQSFLYLEIVFVKLKVPVDNVVTRERQSFLNGEYNSYCSVELCYLSSCASVRRLPFPILDCREPQESKVERRESAVLLDKLLLKPWLA